MLEQPLAASKRVKAVWSSAEDVLELTSAGSFVCVCMCVFELDCTVYLCFLCALVVAAQDKHARMVQIASQLYSALRDLPLSH